MKKTTILFLFLVLFSSRIVAQSDDKQFSIGLQGSQMEGKLGFGINATSPTFLEFFAVRASANLLFSEQINFDFPTGNLRTQYWNVRLGLTGKVLDFGKSSRLYLEGGFIMVIPNRDITSDVGMGGYALAGVEYQAMRNLGLFLEAGGIGYEYDLNNLFNGEVEYRGFSNYSFLISAGVRFYIP